MALALSVWAAQVSGEETEVVQWEDLHRDTKQARSRLKWSPVPTFRAASVSTDPLVELLLLLGEDAGDLLRELDQMSHFHQLLADAAEAGRERAAAGHTVGQLTFWTDRWKEHRQKQNLFCNFCKGLLNFFFHGAAPMNRKKKSQTELQGGSYFLSYETFDMFFVFFLL